MTDIRGNGDGVIKKYNLFISTGQTREERAVLNEQVTDLKKGSHSIVASYQPTKARPDVYIKPNALQLKKLVDGLRRVVDDDDVVYVYLSDPTADGAPMCSNNSARDMEALVTSLNALWISAKKMYVVTGPKMQEFVGDFRLTFPNCRKR